MVFTDPPSVRSTKPLTYIKLYVRGFPGAQAFGWHEEGGGGANVRPASKTRYPRRKGWCHPRIHKSLLPVRSDRWFWWTTTRCGEVLGGPCRRLAQRRPAASATPVGRGSRAVFHRPQESSARAGRDAEDRVSMTPGPRTGQITPIRPRAIE